jgi:outer membrane protein assembly factor BamB
MTLIVITIVASYGCRLARVEPTGEPTIEEGTWPQYRYAPRHLGLGAETETLGTDLVVKWQSEPLAIGDYPASKSSPTIDTDTVYIGVDDGRLYALDREDGSVRWTFETYKYVEEMVQEDSWHRGVHGTAAFDSERVYIGDYAGWLYAVDKETGTLVWEEKLGGSIGASPVLYGGYVFMAVEYPYPDGRVFVLEADTGRTGYRTGFLGNHPHSSVSIDPERNLMFVGANNGYFFCFDFVQGEERWRYQTGGDIKSTAAVAEEIVYITSWSENLHAFDIETGAEVFFFAASDKSMSSPALYEGAVYFGSHDTYLYCVDALTGESIWEYRTGGRVISSPTVIPVGGLVAIGSNNGRIILVDAATGEEQWSYRVGSKVSSVPAAVSGELYVYDDGGIVWCFASP